MIITQGGLAGGWAFYVQDGKPAFHYNAAGVARYTITAQRQLEVGDYALTFAFNRDTDGKGKGGTGVISANGVPIAQGRIARSIPVLVPSEEGLDIGEDSGTPVNLEYDVPFKFTGRIKQVAVQVFEPRKVIAVPVPPLVHR
jgi:arylsulfatase